jgi:hypothetical protein
LYSAFCGDSAFCPSAVEGVFERKHGCAHEERGMVLVTV